MKHNYTSGPWKWKGTRGRPELPCYLDGPKFQRVGQSLDGFTDNPANAQLIAAAPELAEALQAILESFQCFAEGQIGIAFHEQSEVVEAKAALRKAGLLPAE